MTKASLPTPETLRKLLRYEPVIGKLFWRARGVEWFKDGPQTALHACNKWNSQNAGNEAFTADDGKGYLCGRIFGKQYRSHRVIWAMETGAWPVDQIDHEDHDKANNKFKNLTEATNEENGRNLPISSRNSSGFTGVSWCNTARKWAVYIKLNGKNKNLGYFADKSEAIDARKAANIRYKFHKNHGV